MENVIVCGTGSIYIDGVYIGEAQSTSVNINTSSNNDSNKGSITDIYDSLIEFAGKPSKHKKGKKLKCWDAKRFYE